MGIIRKFGRFVGGWTQLGRIPRKLDAIIDGMNNQSRVTNEKSAALIEAADNQAALLDQKLSALVEGFDNLARSMNSLLGGLLEATGTHMTAAEETGARLAELQRAQLIMQREMADALDELTVLAKALGGEPVGNWSRALPAAGQRPAKDLPT